MAEARWLYHVVRRVEVPALTAPRGGAPPAPYSPPSLASEGFVHCSYRAAVAETVKLYFASIPVDDLVVLRIDPRLVAARVEEAATPRGPMPHVHGPIPAAAVVEILAVHAVAGAPDARADPPG